MFCFLAFFSCEREDAFIEMDGPVEALAEKSSLATDAYADIALISSVLEDEFKSLDSVTEDDVMWIATKVNVDLEAVGIALHSEFLALTDLGLTEKEAALVMAKDQASAFGISSAKATPCYDSFITSIATVNAVSAVCITVALVTANPAVAIGCVATNAIGTISANVSYQDCLKNNYGIVRP